MAWVSSQLPDREFLHQSSVRVPTVNRVLVLYVTLLAGFWGGHKFLLGARREGWLYLLLSWTALPLLAALGDFVDLLRQPAIGEGFLRRRLAKRHPAEADMVTRATWKQLGRVLLLLALFVGATVWMVWRLDEGRSRVSALCAQITPGMTAQALAAFAAAHGLKLRAVREGFNVLSDTATFGRHACHVTVASGRVAQSSHYFLD